VSAAPRWPPRTLHRAPHWRRRLRYSVASSDDCRHHIDDCALEKLGATIPIEKIGEPVRASRCPPPSWTAKPRTPRLLPRGWRHRPVDTSATARPINFAWRCRTVESPSGADGRRRHERLDPGLTVAARSTVAARARRS
jgi:hypothetical protein